LKKKITYISYSRKSLSEHILLAQDNQNTIDYLYDATGTKLQKVTSSDRAAGLPTDYSGPFVYEDSKLAFIQTSEGRIVPDHEEYEYEYFLKDHLGNTRVVFNEQGEVLQSNSYYPFGGTMEGLKYTAGLNPENKYLYNGKELQDDFGLDWYDYGARFYDPALGRWHAVDPHADKYYEWSPYNYVYNNPINAIDPDGRDGIIIVFPDYKISTPVGKVGGLGHAGVLLIDNKTGYTRYYEYGRYDKEGKGEVRNRSVSNVKMGKDGMPTQKSLNKVMKQISDKAGHGGKVEGAYIKSDKFKEMNDYAEGKMKENSDPDRKEYNLMNNNCGTFAEDVVGQDEEATEDAPTTIDPRPNSMVEEYQEEYQGVHYDPNSGQTTVDPKKEEE